MIKNPVANTLSAWPLKQFIHGHVQRMTMFYLVKEPFPLPFRLGRDPLRIASIYMVPLHCGGIHVGYAFRGPKSTRVHPHYILWKYRESVGSEKVDLSAAESIKCKEVTGHEKMDTIYADEYITILALRSKTAVLILPNEHVEEIYHDE